MILKAPATATHPTFPMAYPTVKASFGKVVEMGTICIVELAVLEATAIIVRIRSQEIKERTNHVPVVH